MKDIENDKDIHQIMALFYEKLLADTGIAYFFTQVVKLHIEEHLDILVTFWSQSLFGTGGYTKNLTKIHLDINSVSKIEEAHFEIWLKHFNASVDALYQGEVAEKMKSQANYLAQIMMYKIKAQ